MSVADETASRRFATYVCMVPRRGQSCMPRPRCTHQTTCERLVRSKMRCRASRSFEYRQRLILPMGSGDGITPRLIQRYTVDASSGVAFPPKKRGRSGYPLDHQDLVSRGLCRSSIRPSDCARAKRRNEAIMSESSGKSGVGNSSTS